MKNTRNVFYVLLSVALMSGCASKGSTVEETSGKSFIHYEQLQDEYRSSLQKLEFPEGFVPPSTTTEEKDATFQRGYGNTLASYTWQCAWEKEWLSQYSTDTLRANRALNILEKATSMAYLDHAHADDATRRVFKENLDKAKLGDPSGLQNDVTINCP
ncbi:hypothetical protein ACTOVL_05715 [Arcanobacterium canis]